MRILAIDPGDRRSGVSISDLGGTLAGESFTIDEPSPPRMLEKLADAINTRDIAEVVVGYPKNMDGSAGGRAEKSLALAKYLRGATGKPVILWDERRTTVDAHRILSEANRRGKRRREQVDAVAASLILQTYLDSRHSKQ